MTTRANIKITVLQVLDRLPAGYPQRGSALRAEARHGRYRPGHPGAGGPADDHLHHLHPHRGAQVRHHRRRPRPVITDMTIHDTIVTVASLALMAWIVYIVYRH